MARLSVTERAKRAVSVKKSDGYGDGCRAGHFLAQSWLNNPKRGNPRVGGTLQGVILDLAARFKSAASEYDANRIKGEIVGFCYAVECPVDAVACLAADAKRNMK